MNLSVIGIPVQRRRRADSRRHNENNGVPRSSKHARTDAPPARLPTIPAPQVAQLQKLRELLLARDPQLLDSFIEEIGLFQVQGPAPAGGCCSLANPYAAKPEPAALLTAPAPTLYPPAAPGRPPPLCPQMARRVRRRRRPRAPLAARPDRRRAGGGRAAGGRRGGGGPGRRGGGALRRAPRARAAGGGAGAPARVGRKNDGSFRSRRETWTDQWSV
jgi:hypothetical protein